MTTKHTTSPSKPAKPDAKGPTLHAYTVREARGEGQKTFWTRIGAYFPHEDGEGGTLVLDALPLDGRIVLRTPRSEGSVGAPREPGHHKAGLPAAAIRRICADRSAARLRSRPVNQRRAERGCLGLDDLPS